jgi:hypothetical protein
MEKRIIRYKNDKRNEASKVKEDKGWSAEDLAIIGAALIVLGDFLTLLSLLQERQEKK